MVTSTMLPANKTVKPSVKPSDKTPAKAPAKSVMAAPAKNKSAAKPTPIVKPVPATATALAEPSMRFYHSKALRTRTHAVLAALEATPEHPQHADAMADLVTALIEAGMDYYFMRALKLAQVGFVTEQSARLGLSGAVKLISSVNRKFIVRMDKTQLLVVASHIRALT